MENRNRSGIDVSGFFLFELNILFMLKLQENIDCERGHMNS